MITLSRWNPVELRGPLPPDLLRRYGALLCRSRTSKQCMYMKCTESWRTCRMKASLFTKASSRPNNGATTLRYRWTADLTATDSNTPVPIPLSLFFLGPGMVGLLVMKSGFGRKSSSIRTSSNQDKEYRRVRDENESSVCGDDSIPRPSCSG